MKKFSALILSLLFLSSCLLRPSENFCNPLMMASCMLDNEKPKVDLQPTVSASPTIEPILLYNAGLTPQYQNNANDLIGATYYDIEFNISDDIYRLTGTETIQYTNREDVPLNEIHIHLFPNILDGIMLVDNVNVNDIPVEPYYSLNNSVMIIPLKNELKINSSVTIGMDFSAVIAQSVERNYGVQAYSNGILALAHAYPMIAVYDEKGWNEEIPPPSGDITYADASFFSVTVSAPQNIVFAATGKEINREVRNGVQTINYLSGPARDFYLAGSADYQIFTRQAGNITLRFYTNRDHREGAEYALDVAASAIESFSNRYASYPYTELDFVSTPTMALGIEYPGAIAITKWILMPNNKYLEATIAHEVAHQWFYNLVGNDQLNDPWLDESLTQYATMQYFYDEHGTNGYNGFRRGLENRWNSNAEKNIPIGMPVAFYDNNSYSSIIYGRGGLFFEALQKTMGQKVFNVFIKEYVSTNSWRVSTSQSLKTLAENHCKCNLTSLFDEWVY